MRKTATKAELKKEIARLEFIQDQLETEISHIDELLRAVGFPKGLASAKEVAIEIIGSTREVKPD